MRVTSVIDNLDAELMHKLLKRSRAGFSRFEVQLDRVDSSQRETTLHFRLAGLDATRPPFTASEPDHITRMARVVAELMRQGILSPGSIGLPLKPGADRSWNEQAERWLRDG